MAGQTDFSRINADLEAAKEAKNRNSKFEKVEWLRVPFGDTTFMVLPPFQDDQHIFKEVYIHHNFVDNQGRKRSYLCSRQVHDVCPICAKVVKMNENGLTKEASQIQGKRTFLYNVLDIDLKNRVCGFKPSQHNEILQEINVSYADDMIDVTDPKNGRQIKLSRLKVTPWARARVKGITAALQLTPQQVEVALSGMKNLDKVYVDNTPQQLEDMLAGKEVNPGVAASRQEKLDEQDNSTVSQGADSTAESKNDKTVAGSTTTGASSVEASGTGAGEVVGNRTGPESVHTEAEATTKTVPVEKDKELDEIMSLLKD